ncbi:S1 RNA-binding domain-containing protein [Thalassotalea sp. PS06]|uniref:CvfB family protein n=1 Tax=Thalassotalea sp. PS06 TaxID=2594005 RepID=UPI0011657F8C|nr:S1-like domain-containing RNA-binding protein [Thalassotalea sp. PS06]QDP02380.1 GntR family transcriptional regulator [Thalassotalea sp. PS06]
MAEVGKINTLRIIKLTEIGAYLDGAETGEILLPTRYLTESAQEGQDLQVFIYYDSKDRLVATTEMPKAQLEDFAYLKVVQVNKMGAFLDWGLPKDLLVPYNQQKTRMVVGKSYLVKIYRDHYTDRIAASSKLDKFLDIWPAQYEIGEQVDLIIATKTDLGFKAIVNNRHWGLLYDNEVFQHLRTGQKIKGYIKNVRSDGAIDLILTRGGIAKVNDFAPALIAYLKAHKGYCNLHDKSSPEEIKRAFGVSKKTFKSTLGNLLKHKKVELLEQGFRLTDKGNK